MNRRIEISIFFGLAVLFCPAFSYAQVVINEIAWMGSSENANAEWIELRNTGSSQVALDGWTLIAEDGAPSITLSGTIGGSGYFLLERTSDESVPGVTGDVIYVGALGNAGETLVLKNSQGQIIDTVGGGENWENIGGSNVSKETAQKTATGWVTAAATPRAANVSGGTESVEEDESTEQTTTGSSGGGSAPAPSSALVAKASAGKDRTVLAGVATRFEGFAYDAGNKVIEAARFSWNFGDGSVAEGKIVEHQWEYAGKYAVVLEVSRFESKVSHRITITVESPEFELEVTEDGNVIVRNLSGHDADLSRWRIVDGPSTFTFPHNTILLRGGIIRLSPLTLYFNASRSASLLNPSGAVAAKVVEPESAMQTTLLEEEPEEEELEKEEDIETFTEVEIPQQETIDLENEDRDEEITGFPEKNDLSQVAAVAVVPEGSSSRWWWAIPAIILLGIMGVFASRRFRRPHWDIIEDTDK